MKIFIVLSFLFFGVFEPLRAQELSIHKVSVTPGTLEHLKDKVGYVFHPDQGKDVVYELSPTYALSSHGLRPPGALTGIPDVGEIGFKLTDGTEYLYKHTAGRAEAVRQSLAEHPDVPVAAYILASEKGGRIEVSRTGKTPVFRVEIDGGPRTDIYWVADQRKAEPKPGK